MTARHVALRKLSPVIAHLNRLRAQATDADRAHLTYDSIMPMVDSDLTGFTYFDVYSRMWRHLSMRGRFIADMPLLRRG